MLRRSSSWRRGWPRAFALSAAKWTSSARRSDSSRVVARPLWQGHTRSIYARSPIRRAVKRNGTSFPRWASMPSTALFRWVCACSRRFLISDSSSSSTARRIASLPARLLVGAGSEFCRRGLMQADLGHELREAGIGAERVGHGLNGEVDEAVGTLLLGAVKPVERPVVFTEARLNSH